MPGERTAVDTICWLIGTLHQLLGHMKAAAVLGVDPGPLEHCIICKAERGEVPYAEVAKAMGTRPAENDPARS